MMRSIKTIIIVMESSMLAFIAGAVTYAMTIEKRKSAEE